MARTEEHYLSGKSKFFKCIRPDLEYKCWSTGLYLDEKSKDLFLSFKEPRNGVAGILNELKKDDDGYFIQLRRPLSKTFKGVDTPMSPPVVIDANGLPWQEQALIGNGSDITVKIERYEYTAPVSKKKGSAIRLAAVRIDNLVPYEMKKDFTEAQHKDVSGLSEQPKPAQYF